MLRFYARSPLAPAAFSLVTCLLSGCGDITATALKTAMQQVNAKVVEGSSQEGLQAMFKAANDQCPRRMDAYTILQEIKVLDDHRVEFRYLVNEQGKQLTSGLSQCAMRTAAVKAMRGNPLAVAIAERDLSVEHVYNDASGNRILSYTIDREVLAGRQPLQGTSQSNPFDVTTVSTAATNDALENDVSSAVAAEPGSEPVPVDTPDITPAETTPPMPQQFKSPSRSKDNPAGVQVNPYFDTP